MVNRKTFLRLIVLAAALCLVLVGISCKKNKPTEGDEILLEAPKNQDNALSNTTDGMLPDSQKNDFNSKMINVRLLADSGDGAYYRAPVIITYGGATKAQRKSMAIFYEKRYGAGGVGDVGVDGNAKTDIVYMANDRGGDSLDYSKDYIVGQSGSANTLGASYSVASPVVFVHADGLKISVVAAAGTGNLGTTSKNGSGKSEVRISTGDKGSDSISFKDWKDLEIDYNGVKGSDGILKYAQEKIDSKFNAFYTRWGQGKTSGSTWILPLKLMERKTANEVGAQAVLVLYSIDEGANWKFGPYFTLGESAGYNEATGLSVGSDGEGATIRLALVPRNPGNPIGIAQGTLTDSASAATTLNIVGTSSFADSYNNFEMHAPYFINTRERSGMTWNSFIVNKKLTIAVLSDTDNLQESQSMMMSRVAGSGSVAVLADDTIVTVAEEAFSENSRVGENRYNVVQRRFTKGYMDTQGGRILLDDEYYNPNLEGH